MNYNNLTIKSQEALQQAFTIAAANNNQSVENGHLLKSIQENAGDLLSFVFGKAGINLNSVIMVVDRIISSYPKVTGGDAYLSNAATRTFTKAELVAKSMGDDYVSIEHLLMGMIAASDDVAQVLKDNGLTEKSLKKISLEVFYLQHQKGSRMKIYVQHKEY